MASRPEIKVKKSEPEEAQAPREHVPRVLIFAVLGIGVFWALNAWALTLSTPPGAVAKYNAQGLSAITPVARTKS